MKQNIERKKVQELTKAEDEAMRIIWSMKLCSVKEMLDNYPEPKPALTTLSTVVRTLEQKDFIDHEKIGRGYRYFPIIDISTYKQNVMSRVVSNYFQDSFQNLISFFAEHENIDPDELESMVKEVKREIKSDK